MAKIVTVYDNRHTALKLIDMSYIRWMKISEALARCGHKVDIATNEFTKMIWWRERFPISMGKNLKRVPLSKIRWSDYDVVKTLFHKGFNTLKHYGGTDHHFIISKLGSVVGAQDMEGIYFYGENRERLYAIQEQINQTSHYITVLSEPAKQLWTTCFASKDNILLIPGAVDHEIPPPSPDPYPKGNGPRCLFAGNIYSQKTQPEANAVLVDKLNQLGQLLASRGVRLFFLGPGDVSRLNKSYVTYLGCVPYEQSWNYLYFAQVGVVIAAGPFMHNNESSKIYHYLRAGLPVVSEAGFPNDHVVTEANLGFVVENGNIELMAQKVEEAVHKDWDCDHAIKYILNNHTWDKRVEIYDNIITEHVHES